MTLIGTDEIGFWHVRLFSRVEGNPEGCWNFTQGKNSEGYGLFSYRGKRMLAHRAAFSIVNGYLPNDKLVCHHCDNPPCINPQHLFLGTNYDNTMDAIRKGRKFIPAAKSGAAHNMAKLTNVNVSEIRDLLASKEFSQRQIANRFGVSQTAISDISRGKRWQKS